MSLENTALVIGSLIIISMSAMLTMVSYIMLREEPKINSPLKNSSEMIREIEVVTLDDQACQYPGWIQDGICDLPNNKKSCDFDGGDCNQGN